MEFVANGVSPAPHEADFYQLLLREYRDQLLEILKQPDEEKHYALEILFIQLGDSASEALLDSPMTMLPILNRAAWQAMFHVFESFPEKSTLKLKRHVHVRFLSLFEPSLYSKDGFPGCKDVNQFVGLVGTIVRASQPKVLEYRRLYQCSNCKQVVAVEAVAGRCYAFPAVGKCDKKCKNGRMRAFEPIGSTGLASESTRIRVKDYQEVKLQEQLGNSPCRGTIPRAITVVLEDDLVNMCKPGDDVVITGALILRWRQFRVDKPIVSEVVLMANHVEVKNDQRASVQVMPETMKFFQNFWKGHDSNPLVGRDIILQSFCPQVYGMYLVKLAMCVVLAGGVSKEVEGSRVRGQSHLLLIGDPGTGKSQMLKYAAKVTPRSVFTTGAGTTSAGLTVSAVRDGADWQLEAGALVLADGGVCCIDEFSHIREHDRTSIHEAMEQQSISVAKAGMVCKLDTKCTIVAATNPKFSKYDPGRPLELNVGLATPLLSRFDLILSLKDKQNRAWDEFLSDFILKGADVFAYQAAQAKQTGLLWDCDTLQSYLVLVKEKDPEMTPDAVRIIGTYFRLQRTSSQRDPSRTTVRLLESLYRLAEGHARIMYRDFVTIHDAITAVSIMETSMQSSALGQSTNSLHVQFPVDPLREYRDQAKTILRMLQLPEIWNREKAYLDELFEKNPRSAMPPPPPPPSQVSRSNDSAVVQPSPPPARSSFKLPEDEFDVEICSEVPPIDAADDTREKPVFERVGKRKTRRNPQPATSSPGMGAESLERHSIHSLLERFRNVNKSGS